MRKVQNLHIFSKLYLFPVTALLFVCFLSEVWLSGRRCMPEQETTFFSITSRSNGSAWRRQYEADLSEYSGGLSKHDLDVAMDVPHTLRILVKDGKIFIIDTNDSWLTKSIVDNIIMYNSSHHLFWMFLPLYCTKSLPDMEMVITPADWERPAIGQRRVPIFSWSKKVGQSGILYPYWEYLTTESMTLQLENVSMPPWNEKHDVAFFRGSTTGIVKSYNRDVQ
jgi:hypothetical protein